MSSLWFYQTLVASILAALFITTSKHALKKVSAGFLTWITLVVATPIIVAFSFNQGLPIFNSIFLFSTLSSALFYTLSKIVMFWSLKEDDLSVVYPLSSLGPVVTLLIAIFPPLSETPKNLAIIGVVVTVVGSYMLNISSITNGILEPFRKLFKNKGSILMILSMLVSAFVIIFDKIAIKNTNPQNPFFTLLVENLFVIIILGSILYKRNAKFIKQFLPNKWILISLGILSAAYTMIGITAIGQGEVGLISAVRSTQVFFVFVFSYLFFKDKPRPETIFGTLIMMIGIVLIRMGSA